MLYIVIIEQGLKPKQGFNCPLNQFWAASQLDWVGTDDNGSWDAEINGSTMFKPLIELCNV